jgi:hypothetical protein
MPDKSKTESPTLPLPPPRGERIDLAHFFEVASAASLRALAAHAQEVQLNPQPEPPGRPVLVPHIWVGIVASLVVNEQGPAQAPGNLGGFQSAAGRTGGGQK